MPVSNASNQMAGIMLLFIAKMASVASAEISKHLFIDLSFKRPFFLTYVKYCMFSIFLIRYAMNPAPRRQRTSTADEASYAKLENTTSDEEYEVESLTAAEFESLTSDVESEEIEKLGPPDGSCLNNNGVSASDDDTLVEIHIDNVIDTGKDVVDSVFVHDDNEEAKEEAVQDFSVKGPNMERTRRVRFALLREVRSFPERIQRDAKLARLSYRPKIAHWMCRCRQVTKGASFLSSTNEESFSCFFFLAPLRFLSTLTFHIALVFASVASTNLLALSYSVVLFILGVICGRRLGSSERCTLLKIGVLMTNAGGVLMLVHFSTSSLGTSVALASAFSTACYLAVFASVSTKYSQIDVNYILGMVGLFTLTVCTPLLAFLHSYNFEVQTPAPTLHQWGLVLLSAAVGGIVAELLWLRAVSLVSAPMALLSTALIIPLGFAGDFFVRAEPIDMIEVLASLPITLSIIIASMFLPVSILPNTNQQQQLPTSNQSASDYRAGGQRRGPSSICVSSFCNRCFGVRMVDLEDEIEDHVTDTSIRAHAQTLIDDHSPATTWRSQSRDPLRVMMSTANGGRVDSMESVRLIDAINED